MKTALTVVVLVVIAAAIAALRIHGDKSQAYQGVSHIFVGGLFGAWIARQGLGVVLLDMLLFRWVVRGSLVAYLAGGLTVLEVACFLAGRAG